MSKAVETKIADLTNAAIAAAGYELVRVRMTGNGKYAALQIMAERQDGKGMSVEDCAAISHIVTERMEAESDLAGKYDLEVSSPGIDRPLMKLADYKKYAGFVAKVDLTAPLEGQKRFKGTIMRVSDSEVEFGVEKKMLNVPFDAIAQAQLVITDELLKAAKNGQVNH
ncbi:MAG: ribosome maturation factor RimP [Alphaproteobacteria bacterium]|nr:ribosome maturation factor RimP [Alphaproteobacteria bacterium]